MTELVERVANGLARFQVFTPGELRDRDHAKFAALTAEIDRLQRDLILSRARAQAQHERAELWKHRCLNRDQIAK